MLKRKRIIHYLEFITHLSNIRTLFSSAAFMPDRRGRLRFSFLIILLGFYLPLPAKTLHVGAGQTYASITQAIAVTAPGDTILVHEGVYTGGQSISNLQGTAAQWIYITAAPGAKVTFNGGISSWHMIDAAYV